MKRLIAIGGSDAGITSGIKDAIKVDRRMKTNLPDIYAAGDCVETWHKLLQKYTYLPLGSTAHKQGRRRRKVSRHIRHPGS